MDFIKHSRKDLIFCNILDGCTTHAHQATVDQKGALRVTFKLPDKERSTGQILKNVEGNTQQLQPENETFLKDVPKNKCPFLIYDTRQKRILRRQQDERLRKTINVCQNVRVLLVASTVFLLICLPNNTLKLTGFFKEMLSEGPYEESLRAMQCKELFQLIYFFNYALNFFIFGTCSSSFRRALKRLYIRPHHKKSRSEEEALNGRVLNAQRL